LIPNVIVEQIVPLEESSRLEACAFDEEEIKGQETTERTIVTHEVTLKSVMESLSEKGFELDSEQILSYSDPVKDMNIFIGKASDQALIDKYRLPKTAFVVSDEGTCALTLLIREASN
jgi:hypothetical protein